MNRRTITGIIYGVMTYIAAKFVLGLLGATNAVAQVLVVAVIMLVAMALIKKRNR
mgnify:CR=1 FL=1